MYLVTKNSEIVIYALGKTRLKLTLKTEAIEYLERFWNVRKNLKKLGVLLSQIRKWREMNSKIEEEHKQNLQKSTVQPNICDKKYFLAKMFGIHF